MASLPVAILSADFPKAFITAMAVAIICVIVVLTLVCVLAHCWQYILRYRWGGMESSVRTPERWVDPVFEWPQQLMPRSRNNRKRERNWQHRPRPMEKRITLGARGTRCESREGMLRDWTQDEGVDLTPLRNVDAKGWVTCYLPESAGI